MCVASCYTVRVMILLRNLERKTCFMTPFSYSNSDSIMINYPTLHNCSISAAIMACRRHHDHSTTMILSLDFSLALPSSVSFCLAILQELLPLVLSFELPAIMQSDPSSPSVQHISQTYNLTVSFKPPTRLYRATGVVRGSQNNATAVKVRMVML